MAPTRSAFAAYGLYWVTILSACTMGETAADFLSHGPLGLGYALASLILATLVVLALLAQHLAKTPSEARYWVTITVMATAGTTIADFLSRTLDIGYFWSSFGLLGAFLLTLLVGRRRSPSAPRAASDSGRAGLAPVRTRPAADARYWAAIMVASTLGTTLGDFLSNGTEIGFGGGALLLLFLLAVVLLVEARAEVDNEARYWTALVLASTIGATTGDYLTKEEGLNLGYFWGNGLLIAVFVVIAIVGGRASPQYGSARAAP